MYWKNYVKLTRRCLVRRFTWQYPTPKRKKNFPEVLSGVKRGSYDIASFNALLSASPWPHSLAWLKEVHGAGGTRIGWKGVLLYWKRDGYYTCKSTFRIPHSKSVFLICELMKSSDVGTLLLHKPTCIHRPWGKSHILTPLRPSRQVKQWHLEPSVVSFNGIIETMKRAQEWKPGLARWVMMGQVRMFRMFWCGRCATPIFSV